LVAYYSQSFGVPERGINPHTVIARSASDAAISISVLSDIIGPS